MTDQLQVLCVDDEPKVLEGLVLNLRRHFRVSTAMNGQAGLDIVEGNDPPAVVVSDMRMPEMDGATFLSQVKECSPDSVRLLLTGQTDIESAIAAVNHGQVFRFLTKPCNAPTFLAAVQAAAEQHRLITSERVLLEQTLRGSIKALTDILSLTNPLAFGRAVRLKQASAEMVTALGLSVSWQIEVAAMLSQIACITLPPGTHEKLYYGRPLTNEEAEMVQHLPALALQLLENIPRLEAVRAILQASANNFDGSGSPPGCAKGEATPLGARVLKIVGDYDALEASGLEPDAAVGTLKARRGRYDPKLLDVFVRLKTDATPRGLSELGLASIRPGMFLAKGVTSTSGLLLVARGQEVNVGLLHRLRNLPKGTVREPITVFVPAEESTKC
jgi:response regulator RpfG family c-di-GMP phosphodiesterase